MLKIVFFLYNLGPSPRCDLQCMYLLFIYAAHIWSLNYDAISVIPNYDKLLQMDCSNQKKHACKC